jgi:hypothetical protein
MMLMSVIVVVVVAAGGVAAVAYAHDVQTVGALCASP